MARLCRNRSGRECLLCPGSLDINNRTPKRALQMESYPKFHNEVGVPIVRIGCREFKCIGDKPEVAHARNRLDTRKWLASKLAPRKYGDRVEHDHKGGLNFQPAGRGGRETQE